MTVSNITKNTGRYADTYHVFYVPVNFVFNLPHYVTSYMHHTGEKLDQLELTGHASVNLRSSAVFFFFSFFLLLCFFASLAREGKKQITEINGEGMIAGYASVHWTTSVNSDNSSLKEIYVPSLW